MGLAAAPVIRSWIVWREYRAASREAWLADQTLKRLEDEAGPPAGRVGVSRDHENPAR